MKRYFPIATIFLLPLTVVLWLEAYKIPPSTIELRKDEWRCTQTATEMVGEVNDHVHKQVCTQWTKEER